MKKKMEKCRKCGALRLVYPKMTTPCLICGDGTEKSRDKIKKVIKKRKK